MTDARQAGEDRILPPLRLLAGVAMVVSASFALLWVVANGPPIVLFGDYWLGAFVPHGGAGIYVALMLFFLLTFAESRWSDLAVGVRAFAVFCLAQVAWTTYSMFHFRRVGSYNKAQIPSLLIHLVLCIAAVVVGLDHGRRGRQSLRTQVSDLPIGFVELAQVAFVSTLMLGIWPVLAFPFRHSYTSPGLLWFIVVGTAAWVIWNRFLRKLYRVDTLLERHPTRRRLAAARLASFALLVLALISLSRLEFRFYELDFIKLPVVPLAGAALSHGLMRYPLRRAWRLPLIATLAGAAFSLLRFTILVMARGFPSDESASTLLQVSLTLFWTLLPATALARLSRAD